MKKKFRLLAVLMALCMALSGCISIQIIFPEDADASQSDQSDASETVSHGADSYVFSLDDVPPFSGSAYVALNDNMPVFEDTTTAKAFETYSELDDLGRCGVAFANVCPELMPKSERGTIGSVKPSGWQSVKYDLVDGLYLYNRCHLIGYQLTGENANKRNLITGTRYLNVEGMLPFENMVADYVTETKNHVLYRVTPVFVDEDLVARGVQMEAWSVEDEGEGVCFNVWCYNNQPGITIDYATGESTLSQTEEDTSTVKIPYILNTKQKKFHLPSCPSVKSMKKENRKKYRGNREELLAGGYEPCKSCNP